MVPDMQTCSSGIKILADYVHADGWVHLTPVSSGFFLLMCTGHTEVQTWWRVWEISACGERRHAWACGQRHLGQQRWRHLGVVGVRRLWSCRTWWLDLARLEDPVGCRWGAQRSWNGEDMLESLSYLSRFVNTYGGESALLKVMKYLYFFLQPSVITRILNS
jgi:hypothetical protein